jgi:hypothetical protein
MKMSGSLKVATPTEYIAKLTEPRKSAIAEIDAFIRKTVPKLEPFILSGMLAYGGMHYKYASGREGYWARVMLASNKQYISLYVCAVNEKGYIAEQYKRRLPKASIGKSCVRFKSFADLDRKSVAAMLKDAAKATFGVS